MKQCVVLITLHYTHVADGRLQQFSTLVVAFSPFSSLWHGKLLFGFSLLLSFLPSVMMTMMMMMMTMTTMMN